MREKARPMTYFSKLQIFGVPVASLLEARAKNGAEEVPEKSHAPSPGSVIKKQSRWLSYKELKPLKGISYSRIHLKRLEDAGKFPKRIECGARVYWCEHEVDEWKQRQADARLST
jgi:prophage regulatory protein